MFDTDSSGLSPEETSPSIQKEVSPEVHSGAVVWSPEEKAGAEGAFGTARYIANDPKYGAENELKQAQVNEVVFIEWK